MARLTSASYIKITLIVLLAVVVCAAFGLGTCSYSPLPVSYQGTVLTQVGNADVDAGTVKNIEINWAAGTVDIKTAAQGSTITLAESAPGSISRGQEMRWQVIGDTLAIDYGTWGTGAWGFNIGSCSAIGDKHLEVTIPQNLARTLGSLEINGASGDYRVNGIACDSFNTSLASGSLNAAGMTVNSLNLKSASGTMTFQGQVSKSVSLDTASGDIEVTCEKVVPNTVDASMASGKVTVWIPENDGFTASVTKLSGAFNSDFTMQQNGDTYLYKNGGTRISVSILSGAFSLRKVS